MKWRLRCFAFSPYPRAGASFRYRILQYEDMLSRAGIKLEWYSFLDDYFFGIRRRRGIWHSTLKLFLAFTASIRLCWAITKALKCDLVIVHREIFPLGPPFVETFLARRGIRIIFDIDDAIFHSPATGIDQRRFLRDPDRVKKTAKLSVEVTVGSPYLQKKIFQWNKNCFFLPTSIDTDIYTPAIKTANQQPVIGWIGNWGNAIYLRELMPVFVKLARKHNFVLKLVGGDDIFEIQPKEVKVYHKLWKLEEEISDVASFDIGIMPLIGKPYDLGKGAFKLIQYMGMGIPVVASPVGMNVQVVEDGENGFLASELTQWEYYLEILIKDEQLRKHLGDNGRNKIITMYSKQVTGGKLIEILKQSSTKS